MDLNDVLAAGLAALSGHLQEALDAVLPAVFSIFAAFLGIKVVWYLVERAALQWHIDHDPDYLLDNRNIFVTEDSSWDDIEFEDTGETIDEWAMMHE